MRRPKHVTRFLVLFGCWFLLPSLADIATAAEAKPLFNGKDLSGWRAIKCPISSWTVHDGMLSCSGGANGWLATETQHANFELELEFRVPSAGNSGIFLRTPEQGNPAYDGLEIQVLDDESPKYTELKPFQYCGSLYDLMAPSAKVAKKANQWQTVKIVCDHRIIQVTLNDRKVVDANLDDLRAHESTHPGLKRSTGFIGLQNHGEAVDFKNIRIRELP
jgi:hypothetical protein